MKSYKTTEKVRAASRKYYHSHLKKVRAYGRTYHRKHRAERRAYGKIYNKTYYAKYGTRIEIRFRKARWHAKRRGKDWKLTLEQFSSLTKRVCSYCGGELPKFGSGLDRQNNKKGYTIKNVVPCCSSCNTKKGALELAGFVYPRSVELLREVIHAH